jgi:hypothetical protein
MLPGMLMGGAPPKSASTIRMARAIPAPTIAHSNLAHRMALDHTRTH